MLSSEAICGGRRKTKQLPIYTPPSLPLSPVAYDRWPLLIHANMIQPMTNLNFKFNRHAVDSVYIP